MNLWLYTARRLLTVPLVLMFVSTVTFFLLQSARGDAALLTLGEHARSAEQVARQREALGLNRPATVQFVLFLRDLGRGELRSWRSGELIHRELLRRFPATIELTVAGMLIAMLIGVSAGIVSALRQHSVFDHAASTVAIVGVSVPVFWLGLILIWLFAHRWVAWTGLPTSDRLDPLFMVPRRSGFMLVDTLLARDVAAFGNALRHLVLPALTLGLISSAFLMRMTRASLLEVKRQDYVRTARAKGLAPHQVLRHQMRNALIPIITVVGLQLGALLGGAIITETIFSWEGLGSYLVDRIHDRDINAVCAATMMMAGVFVVVNLIVDVLYHVIDPRVRA